MILKDLCHKVPIPLYDILELNEEAMTVRVEPMVTVGDITRYLIPKGLSFYHKCTLKSSFSPSFRVHAAYHVL